VYKDDTGECTMAEIDIDEDGRCETLIEPEERVE
jgi:hypothetical protein